MPFMHSESLMIHQAATELFSRLGVTSTIEFEAKYKRIIERFGRYCCGQVFSYIMTGAFMLPQPQRDLNIDCNYVLYDNCNVEYIS
jgi:hypothetical protein